MKGKLILGVAWILALLVMAPVAFAGDFEINGTFTPKDHKATIPCKAVKGLLHSPNVEHIIFDVFLAKVGLTVETADCFD